MCELSLALMETINALRVRSLGKNAVSRGAKASPPRSSPALAQLAVGEEPRLELTVGHRDATVQAQVALLAAAHQPLIVHYANLVQPPVGLASLPPAVRELVPAAAPHRQRDTSESHHHSRGGGRSIHQSFASGAEEPRVHYSKSPENGGAGRPVSSVVEITIGGLTTHEGSEGVLRKVWSSCDGVAGRAYAWVALGCTVSEHSRSQVGGINARGCVYALAPGEGGVFLLHGPEHLLVGHGAVLHELSVPPVARAQHRVAVRLVVVLRRRLGVALYPNPCQALAWLLGLNEPVH
jgi:hypothetical protein